MVVTPAMKLALVLKTEVHRCETDNNDDEGWYGALWLPISWTTVGTYNRVMLALHQRERCFSTYDDDHR
jgi:hypothetical protein